MAALGAYVAAVRALLGTRGDESVCLDGEHFRYCVPPFRVATALPPPPVWWRMNKRSQTWSLPGTGPAG